MGRATLLLSGQRDRVKPCGHCGKLFEKSTAISWAQWHARIYCSMACSGASTTASNAKSRPTVKQKFEARFDKSDGCWEWKGTIDGYGYGVLDHNRRRYRAHVLALEFDGRPVPKGMVACHKCDNPKCVRPDHLYVGSHRDNVHDAVARNRIAYGERNPNAKLTNELVRQMRAIDAPFAEIARRFGVSRPTAARAIKGETWRRA